MSLRREATFFAGAAIGGLVTWGSFSLLKNLPWLIFFLDYSFWLCFVALACGKAVLLGIYLNRIGTSRHSRAVLSAVVIMLCATSFPAMEQVAEHIRSFAENDPDRLVRRVLLAIDQFMQTGMLVLTLGVAALAVNLLADTFPRASTRG